LSSPTSIELKPHQPRARLELANNRLLAISIAEDRIRPRKKKKEKKGKGKKLKIKKSNLKK